MTERRESSAPCRKISSVFGVAEISATRARMPFMHAENWVLFSAEAKHVLQARRSSVRYCVFVCMLYLWGRLDSASITAEIAVFSAFCRGVGIFMISCPVFCLAVIFRILFLICSVFHLFFPVAGKFGSVYGVECSVCFPQVTFGYPDAGLFAVDGADVFPGAGKGDVFSFHGDYRHQVFPDDSLQVREDLFFRDLRDGISKPGFEGEREGRGIRVFRIPFASGKGGISNRGEELGAGGVAESQDFAVELFCKPGIKPEVEYLFVLFLAHIVCLLLSAGTPAAWFFCFDAAVVCFCISAK